jgi:hypothetical protein
MGLALKELGKVMAVLENDRLIRVYVDLISGCTADALYPQTIAIVKMNLRRVPNVLLADSITTSTTSTFAMSSSGEWRRCIDALTQRCET